MADGGYLVIVRNAQYIAAFQTVYIFMNKGFGIGAQHGNHHLLDGNTPVGTHGIGQTPGGITGFYPVLAGTLLQHGLLLRARCGNIG